MTTPARTHSDWRKSSYSAANGGCVEVAWTTRVHIRDSKHPTGPALAVTAHQWHHLVSSLR